MTYEPAGQHVDVAEITMKPEAHEKLKATRPGKAFAGAFAPAEMLGV